VKSLQKVIDRYSQTYVSVMGVHILILGLHVSTLGGLSSSSHNNIDPNILLYK